jgi:hypothetical protein
MQNRVSRFFEKQWLHAVLLFPLVLALHLVSEYEGISRGALWGITSTQWFWTAAVIPIAHQVYVWLCWRAELDNHLITRTFGAHGFSLYATLFSILGIARVVVVFILAVSNRNTFPFALTPLRVIAIIALVPSLYLFYSVKRYFTVRRAFGADHFDEQYRTMPLEKKGIYRFTQNGMYIYGFLILWVPALWWASEAALCIALFNHLYIWVHYYSTEKPDMNRIHVGKEGTE